MSDDEGEEEMENEDEMVARQKKVLKRLEDEGRIRLKQARKVKGEKGKQKVQEAEALLTQEMENLKEAHSEELKALRGGSGGSKQDPESPEREQPKEPQVLAADEKAVIEKKRAKAQRKKDNKAQREREREEENEREMAAAGPSLQSMENERLARALKAQGLRVHEIRADGNCLYRAIDHQLELHDRPWGYNSLRKLAAKQMRKQQGDFVPFLMDVIDVNKTNGDVDTAFQAYCSRVETTADWGGQPEIIALCRALESAIWIHDGDGGVIKMGEEYGDPLHVSYHHHYLSSGEHYNSVVPDCEAPHTGFQRAGTFPSCNHGSQSKFSAFDASNNQLDYFTPGLLAGASFMLALINLKKLHSFQKSVQGLREPLMHL